MKKLLFLCLAGSLFGLAGCKTNVYAPVSISEIYGAQKEKICFLAVQVPSCTDSSNKFESNSVLEAKQKIPYIFPSAKYLKCGEQGFESFAGFEIPLQVGGTEDQCKPDQICIFHSQKDQWAEAKIGEEILKKAKEVSKGNVSGRDLMFLLGVTNDTNKPFPLFAPASIIDGKPVYQSEITINSGAKDVEVFLSDVASEWMLRGNTAPIFKDISPKN